MRSRMEDEGVGAFDVAMVRSRANAAEDYFIEVTGARRATTSENIAGWDCVLEGHRIDIKSIERHHVYVLGASSPLRPRVTSVVVEVDDKGRSTILGYIEPWQWQRGAVIGTKECWYVPRSMIIRSARFDELQAAWRRKTDEELR